jgi:Ca-activated chloride channel family protein
MMIFRPRSPRRSRFSHILLLLSVTGAVTVLLAFCAQAQTADPVHIVPLREATETATSSAPGGGEPVLNTRAKPLVMNVERVLVPVTVTDAANHMVTGLQQENFALYEGDALQQIRSFSTEDVPLSLGVLLDLSRSMTNKLDVAREAVAEFFKSANPQDDFFVITFSDRPRVLADYTESLGNIQASLATARAEGHTALLDAIYLGVSKMRSARHQRRALLIISDGGDNRSRYRAQEIKNLVQEADVEIYAVGLFDSIFKTPEERAGKRLLTSITEATGGRTITLSNPSRLPQVTAAIGLELRNQYVLGYQPKDPLRDGKWRKIKVQLTPPSGSPRLQVYSRRGYLAPSE